MNRDGTPYRIHMLSSDGTETHITLPPLTVEAVTTLVTLNAYWSETQGQMLSMGLATFNLEVCEQDENGNERWAHVCGS